MAPSSTLIRTLRPSLRFNPTSKFTTSGTNTSTTRFFTSNSSSSRRTQYSGIRNAWQRMGMRNAKGKRWQSSDAAAAGTGASQAQVSWFKRMWDSPIGLKTVHFWAPIMKWGLVIAGISDLARPAEMLSLTQNCALTATGIIWTRWCLIIKPRNILLATVNFFLGMVGIVQVSRILMYNQSQKNKSTTEVVEDKAAEIKGKVVDAVKS